jgi:prolyl oligopeptidase
MLRYHLFTIGSHWMTDYGSPDDPEEFRALRAYSPYHNVRSETVYPPTLITTGDHDDRVFPAHSYKFAAALQRAQRGKGPILIRIDTEAGHGMGKPLSKTIAELTDQLTFLAHYLSMDVSRAEEAEPQ